MQNAIYLESTPFGSRKTSTLQQVYSRLVKLAGVRYDKENNSWSILSDKCEYYHITGQDKNTRFNRRVKKEGYLPIRYYNFIFALSKCKDNLVDALDYAEKNLFKNGKPVYLPELLEDIGESLSYSQIINDIEEFGRVQTQKSTQSVEKKKAIQERITEISNRF